MSCEYQKQYYIDNVKSKGLVKCELCGKKVQLKRLEFHKQTKLCLKKRENLNNNLNCVKIKKDYIKVIF